MLSVRLTAAGVTLLLLILCETNSIGADGSHIWHNGPINCYHCDSLEECTASFGTVRKCENNDAQYCTAVFNAAGAVIQRGCSDNLAAVCSTENTNCYECRSHGCNSLSSSADLVECVHCDAQIDDNCVSDIELVTGTRQCHERCITALYARTSDTGSPLELVRSCLDDLGLDEREACADGTLENCVACTTSKCNTVDLGVRRSCNHCSAGSCSNPEASTCRAVAVDNDDQCAIEIDETGEFHQLGCRSQYNVTDVTTLVASKRLWLCTGDNCNTADKLPAAHECQLCSSRTDPNCATNPEAVTTYTTCDYPINTDCYARILDNGHTERGCLTTLESDDYVECLGNSNSTKCTSCTGEKCNVALQPIERLSCHVCSSTTDDNCAASPDAATVCVIYDEDQQCVTSVESDGTTRRGCSAEVTCDPNDKQHCQMCADEDNCNTANLDRRGDGRPGLWHPAPLACIYCTHADCGLDLSAACISENEYCMTVFAENGTVITRGCTDEVEEVHGTFCDANPGLCHNCNSNGCNNATALSDYNSCIYCDSSVHEDCIQNPESITRRRQCNGKCMSALKLRSEESTIYDLHRSCLDDKLQADQDACVAGDDNECVACTGDACNISPVPADGLKCYHCSDSEDCITPDSSSCTQYSPTNQCYMLFDTISDVVGMGCVADQSDSFVITNLHLLYLCDGDNCNSYDNYPLPTNCIQCDSISDPNCAVDPTRITNVALCSQPPHTGCMTRVLTNGTTQRGCQSSLTTANLRTCLLGSASCSVCDGARCNAEIFPADRRRCHRCNSVTDPTCESSPAASAVCPTYKDGQFCTAKWVEGHTYRDCETEFICDDSDKQYCRRCSSGDNCNVADLDASIIGYPGKWQTPPINCYHCAGNECHSSDSLGALRKCENNDEQNCATVFATNGSVILRSCTDILYDDEEMLQYCDENGSNCKFCKSTGCNNANSLSTYSNCVLCDGADNGDCVRAVDSVGKTVSCHSGCFTGLYRRNDGDENPAYELARGCLDDLEYDDREECANGSRDLCVACTDAECNKAAVPETRLSCYYCADSECATVESKVCSAYREDDQCYIHVNGDKVQDLGCVSDKLSSFVVTNQRDLQVCNTDNCNDKDTLTSVGVSCYQCNSTSSSDCISPTISDEAVCQHLLYPQCYTRLTTDGVVVRGCVMDLNDDQFDSCLSGNSDSCAVCDSNGCNKEVYPSDWRSCLRCDSNDDDACEANAGSFADYCPVYSADESCVTRLERTRTRRGCDTELYCDATQTDSCRICTESNCNDVNLMAGYVGEPGRWQSLPLTCHVCTDEASCAATASGSTETCTGNNRQVCSTVFGTTDQVVARGCSDTIDAEYRTYCETNPSKCFKCKSDECNNANSLDVYVDCFYCDSHDDESCAHTTPTVSNTRTRKCQGQCMQGLYPRSSASDSALLPTRSCLDDLNESERTLCAAGSHGNCTACSGSLCNTANIVEEPFECYHCTSEDCEDMESKPCVAYRPEDQCYSAYNTEGVIALGCGSDFESPVLLELVAQKTVMLCDEKNCNSPALFPQPTSCLQCSSDDDSRCATNPNQLLTLDVCSTLPYTHCVTKIDDQGVTTRGCLSALESSTFYGCWMGDDALCQVCEDDRCNGLTVFPTDRLRCHQCDSATDSSCASSPSSSSVCPIYEADGSCVTTLKGDVTHRGCSSSLQCDNANDTFTCRTCHSDGCNTVDLQVLNVDGKPGTWQELPISCYTCDSVTNCATGLGTAQQCTGDVEQNCVTVFDENGVVSERGCSANVLSDATDSSGTYCETNPSSCPRCNSNECNVATSLDEYVECLVCDSTENGDCVQNAESVTKTRRCYKHCMTALLPLFGEDNDAHATLRNCYDDMDPVDRDACADGTTPEKCSTCSTAKCNTDDVVAQRLSCYSCTGDECQDMPSGPCPNYREGDQCYIEFDERRSVVGLGCLSNFSHSDIYTLQRSKRLLICDENNCNTLDSIPEAHECVLCSSRTDARCATNPGTVASSTTCQLTGIPECYSRVLDGGYTERGCVSSLEGDEFLSCYNGTSSTCNSCSGASCNNLLYPTERASCHICSSSSDSTCTSSPNHLSICPLYAEGDACVTSYQNGVTTRGCATSVSCDESSRSCVKCVGDGCNTVDLEIMDDDNFGKWQDLPLTCLTCKDDECNSDVSALESALCQDNNEQDCTTVFDVNGAVVQRGCADSVANDQSTYCTSNRNNCPTCKSNDCNTATSLNDYQQCIYCDSFSDVNCLWQPLNSSHKTRQCHGQCMTALYGSITNGLDVIRTCLNDKEVADQVTCAAGSDTNCIACSGNNCNVHNVPEDRLSCLTCEGDDCEHAESQLCAQYKEDDKCFIWIGDDNSIQQMGCLSSFRNQELESILRTKRISVCDGENCNVPILPSPTRCGVCDSKNEESCATNAQDISTYETCSQLPHTSCFTKLWDDGSTTRGCLYDMDQSEFVDCLLGNDQNCTVCATDGCNREIFPVDRLQCYTCSSTDDTSCEANPSYSLACPWVTASETCTTSLVDNTTTRGCASSINCDTNDFRNCRACTSAHCNSIMLANREDDGLHGLWQELPLRCHVCEGEHCLSSLGPSANCSLNTEQDCKTVFEEDGVTVRRRGCADDVDDYEDRYCRQNPEFCFTCKSNECNSAWSVAEYETCHFCHSENDENCVNLAVSQEGVTSRSCHGKCMVAMSEGHLVRSCLNDKELFAQSVCTSDGTGTNCASCEGEQCNSIIFPEDRHRCHVCADAACLSSRSEYCRVYDPNDSCFAKFLNGQVEVMGCLSDQNSADLEQWRDDNLLFECEESECNDRNGLPDSITCVSCDSSRTLDCAQSPSSVSTTITCHAPNNNCVTRLDSGGHTIRGCLSALSTDESASCVRNGTCASCTGTQCNTDEFPGGRRRCNICNSAADNNCASQPDSIQICPIYSSPETCVTKYESSINYLQRGCGSEITCDATDERACQICNTDGCNTIDLSSSATALHNGWIGFIIALIVALRVAL